MRQHVFIQPAERSTEILWRELARSQDCHSSGNNQVARLLWQQIRLDIGSEQTVSHGKRLQQAVRAFCCQQLHGHGQINIE